MIPVDFAVLLTPPPRNGGTRRFTVVVVLGTVTLLAAGLVMMLLRDDAPADVEVEPGGATTIGIATSSTSEAVEEPPVFPSTRLHAQATFDSSTGTIVLFGGQSGRSGPPSEGTWLFDLADGLWRNAFGSPPESTPVPAPRVGHAMVFVDSLGGAVMYGGGADRYVPGGSCAIAYCPVSLLADTWLFDGESGTWRNLNPSGDPGPRYGQAIAYDSHSDRVVLFGGVGIVPDSSDEPGILGDTWTYDPAANQWEQLELPVRPAPKVLARWSITRGPTSSICSVERQARDQVTLNSGSLMPAP